MKNVRNHRDIKLVTTDKRRNQLASEPNYHTTKYFSENVLVIEMKKIKVKMNKAVYFGFSILEISKRLMYEFWHNYIKSKYQNNTKLCYMDIDNLKLNIFIKILQMMMKKDLIHQIMKLIGHWQQKGIKKS